VSKDRLYLESIRDCLERIAGYTAAGESSFMTSCLIQDAVIRNLEVIGEATKNLSPELRAASPEASPGITLGTSSGGTVQLLRPASRQRPGTTRSPFIQTARERALEGLPITIQLARWCVVAAAPPLRG
jgi:hypothetical protein